MDANKTVWTNTPLFHMGEADEKHGAEWDTDAEFVLLSGFIEQHCSEQAFVDYCNQVAAEDAADLKANT